ncbi:MAG TPA: invasion associated locus B family protein [Alphaproteobacteria bacterium]|nr:invasion associated locus B family protein [Alphaproteobacteria bacterium]
MTSADHNAFAATARCLAAIFVIVALTGLAAAPAWAQSAREQSYQDWRVRCEQTSTNQPESCFMFQSVAMKQNNQRILDMAVRYPDPKQPPIAYFTLPLGIALPDGMLLQVDQGEVMRLQIEVCNRAGCHTRLQLAKAMLTSMKQGKQVKVAFDNGQRKRITVPVSLAGFTAALGALH